MTDTQPPAGTAIPRWTAPGAGPGAGYAHWQTTVPPRLVAGLRRLAAGSGVELPALLLAAHLKVLGAVSSEATVTTGYRSPDGLRLCTATLAPGTWRDLLAEAIRAARTTAASTAGAGVETVLDVAGLDAAAPADPRPGRDPQPTAALCVAYAGGDDLALRLTYRLDVLTADAAERVGGYQLAALRLLAADADAAHDAASLLSDTEVALQLDKLAGPRRPLPGKLFVELFEERAARHPAAVAAVHGARRCSYAELNTRANKIAHWLRDHGMRAQDVVAVVTGRNLDWLAAALGTLKAGGVYLPVRPDFPAGRIATQLERSGCRYAVTEPDSEGALHAALASAARGCLSVRAEDAYRTSTRAGNPQVPTAPGDLAYIYFTSGSTGAPKGAMCEHEGMLNHLYAKIDDLRLGAGDVVTQTASQCFDISLWQLLAPLLVGGQTEIVDTGVQLDAGRFIDRLAAGGIQVIQVVPAYLDALLTHLERHPRTLGDLRSVSVTGEALKLGLVRRWFALFPDIDLVNAYGATEVSDDTMHAVLRGVPERDLAIVPVGRSLRNVNTYILDERLRLVPLGAPGEVAFSGVCVGRGYVNDPERTAESFTTDPYRPGTRLYRTGDFGRWLPEGTIEFLGRRDEQVKIRGYRIEIGEVENRLQQVPGVHAAAVVIDGPSDQTRHLAAFYAGSEPPQPADLRDFLAAALPDYMVPAYFHRLDTLPLSENGKVDKRRLAGWAATMRQRTAAYTPLATPTERRLATAWAEVLGVPVGRISRADDFFRLGGTSLAAVRLVVRLDRQISLRQLVAHPVLADLAATIDAGPASAAGAGPTAPASGAVTLLQPLCTPDSGPVASLVCFPYAGGNAVNFQLVARELARTGVAVYGVELPGHDLAGTAEPLADVAEVASRVHAELAARSDHPVLLWGHCAGAAYAVELARLLERDGRPPARVFVAAMPLDQPDALRREIAEVSALSNREITGRLHDDSAYIELDLLKTERADAVGRAYRHDVCSTNRYLAEIQEDPGRDRLRTPVEVVAAADDPTTGRSRPPALRWERVAETVTVHTLHEGGHYFVRSRPADVAALVSTACPAPVAGRQP